MAELICLANSIRHDGRCVAGIDIESGRWVRPVGSPGSGVATSKVFIGGDELALLDVFEVPLLNDPLHDEYQRENRLIGRGAWRITGQVDPEDLLPFCEDDAVVLHNHSDRVSPDYLESLGQTEWQSLQLVHARDVRFGRDYYDRNRWRASFEDGSGHHLYLKITDPVASDRLRTGDGLASECVLTVSLAGPWAPPDGQQEERCYKLVAGVIEM